MDNSVSKKLYVFIESIFIISSRKKWKCFQVFFLYIFE